MAISNNSELKTAIANWANRSDMTSEIPDFIRLAESRIMGEFKSQHLLTQTTITADAASKSLPSDYRGAVSAYIDSDPKVTLDYYGADDFYKRWASSQTGKPKAYTIIGQTIKFGPIPDTSYDVILTHYSVPDIATDTTNSLLTNYPGLYLYASMVELAAFLDDTGMLTKYESLYIRSLQRANAESDYMGSLNIQLVGAP